jgi:hypothetical protein
MTDRDTFAAAALTGLLAHGFCCDPVSEAAPIAYAMADAMLAAHGAALASGQTSGQDSLAQNQSAPENMPACDAQEPAKQAVTLTDAEREALEWAVEVADSLAECSGAGTGGEPSREADTLRGLLARATKEGQ